MVVHDNTQYVALRKLTMDSSFYFLHLRSNVGIWKFKRAHLRALLTLLRRMSTVRLELSHPAYALQPQLQFYYAAQHCKGSITLYSQINKKPDKTVRTVQMRDLR
jgi:hypothetical protein